VLEDVTTVCQGCYWFLSRMYSRLVEGRMEQPGWQMVYVHQATYFDGEKMNIFVTFSLLHVTHCWRGKMLRKVPLLVWCLIFGTGGGGLHNESESLEWSPFIRLHVSQGNSYWKAPHLPEEQLGGNEGCVTVSICTVIIFCKAPHLPKEQLHGNEGCYCLHVYSDHLP
jgi:hypothetical protein